MEKNIYEQIKAEEKEFNDTWIEVVDGCKFNQKSTIKRILLYYNSRFESGEKDSEGFKKHFYNIVEAPCHIASKAVDLDTKDIHIKAVEGQSYLTSWLLEKDLKLWMKERNFGKVLNDIVRFLPIFGSVVVKVLPNDIYLVDLRHFIVEQDAETLDKSNYIIEKHFYTPQELRKMPWKNIEKTIREFRKTNDKFIRVYERYGEVPESWLKGGSSQNYVLARFIVADVGDGIILEKSKIDKLPYKEVHWEKIPGRWLGLGQVEKLFDVQIRLNELVNLKAKGLYWSSLHVFQTRDQTVNRNLLADVRNGDILRIDSEITPIVNEDRNLSAFNQEEQRWDALRDERTFAYDVIKGERLPAGTPLGAAQLAAYMAGSYFDQKREQIGLFLKELFYDVVIPMFKKEMSSKDHIIQFYSDEEDIEKLDKLLLNFLLHKRLSEFVKRNGFLPLAEHFTMLKTILWQKIKDKKEKFVKIPANFYDNLRYKIDIIITGEQVDVQARMVTLQTALNIIASNPTILENPKTKKIFYRLLDLAGVSPAEFEDTAEMTQNEAFVAPAQRGGSLPRITAPQPSGNVLPQELRI